MRWGMLALLLGGCNQEGDGVAEGEGSNPGQTEPIETDWDPFEAGLNLLADGLVVPRGATLDLGAAPTGGGVMSTSLLLSNSSDSPVSLGGEPDSWIGGDGQIGWDLPPPDTLAPGEVAEIAVTFEPTLEGLALAPLDLPNGSSWTLQGFGERPAHVVIVGRLGRTLVSDDYGASFFQDSQEADVPADDQWANDANLQDITYANGQFVAVGGVWERRFAVSEDGTSWTFVNTGYPGSLSTVDYGLGVYFATDGGSILWSTNGINWIEEASSWRPSLGSVAFGNDRFVGVSGTRRAVSLDGTSWHLDIDAATDLAAVTFGNGVFVAVGPQGRVASSADGESWNEQTIGSASRYSVAYGNGVFVLGGWPDNTWTSSDGQTWVEHPDGDSLSPLGFAGGQFFADSWVDQLWRSPDGIHWTMVHDDSDPQMGGFTAVAWGREP